jgi:VanZ family protein
MKHYVLIASRLAAWLLILAITVLSLVPPDLRPETSLPHDLEHFAIFAAAGFAFGFGYRDRARMAAVSLVAFSGAIELAQMAVPGRHARLGDFVVDALAMVVALAAGALVMNRFFSQSFRRNL